MKTTLTLGFNATAVQRGMRSLGGLLGKTFGAIGRGGLERIGHQATDWITRLAMALPSAIKETLDWAGGMNDLATATGVSTGELAKMQEILRLGGAGVDSLRMLSNLAMNIQKANNEGGDLAETIAKLGLHTDELASMPLAEQFESVARAASETEMPLGELVESLGLIFEGRVGFKLLSVFKDFAANSERAGRNVKFAAGWLDEMNVKADNIGDALGRWDIIKKSFLVGFIDLFERLGGSGRINKLFDSINFESLRNGLNDAISFVGRNLEVILQTDFQELIAGIGSRLLEIMTIAGTALGDAIAKSVTSGLQNSEIVKEVMSMARTFTGGSSNPVVSAAVSGARDAALKAVIAQPLEFIKGWLSTEGKGIKDSIMGVESNTAGGLPVAP